MSLRDNSLSIWFSERTDSSWASPIKLGPQINAGVSGKWSPSVSPDGQKLYYVDDSRGGFYWDIWVSTFDSSINDWGTSVNLGSPVNTTGAEGAAHVAPDGRQLYFTSDGSGRCGIYRSEWDGTSWSVPQLQWGSCTPEYPSVTAD
ncbi:MAG: TolB family protein, partial [Limisphaerales bacterium]